MILVGRDRAIDRGVLDGVNWIVGDAEKVPLKSRSVDVYTIAFGLRNVTRIDEALAEARRVLKPGGRFFCLEFSRVVVPVLRDIYDRYSFTVLPRFWVRWWPATAKRTSIWSRASVSSPIRKVWWEGSKRPGSVRCVTAT